MDFFQAQRSARRRTWLLVPLFAVAVPAIVSTYYVTFHGLLIAFSDAGASVLAFPNVPLLKGIVTVTFLVILLGTVYRTEQLRRGGPAVAELVGGRVVDPSTTDAAERRLLNVVEEMAVASGVPVPAVYVLDEDGINAFAAGHTIHDAAVAVTRGALERLDRDELQGVVAHEFSHILNGDMRLNVRMIGLLFGLVLIPVAGWKMIARRDEDDEYAPRSLVDAEIAIAALTLIGIGYIGVLMGRLIKATISRQREFLADAAAVQLTRNPEGIAGALKKIGGYGAGSRVRAGNAEELSHLFFAEARGQSLLASHPPLVDRIRRIDPEFDGELPEIDAPSSVEMPESAAGADDAWTREPAVAAFGDEAGLSGATVDGPGEVGEPPAAESAAAADGDVGETLSFAEVDELIASIGDPTAEHVSYAVRLLKALPSELDAAAHTPGGAQALVLALVFDVDDDDVVDRQQEVIRGHGGDELLERVHDLAPRVRAQPGEARLALLDLALPALTRLPPKTAAGFRDAVHELIHADGRLHLFEYALFRVLSRHLPAADDRPTRRRRRTVRSLVSMRDDVSLVLSAVARVGTMDEAEARAAFEAGAATLPASVGRFRVRESDEGWVARVERALDRLGGASFDVRRRFLEACARCVAHDGRIRPPEVAFLRVIAEGLDCPVPPVIIVESDAPPHPVATVG